MSIFYYTDQDRDSLVFYQVPKVLFIGEQYKKMKSNAKILYTVLLDRIKLSIKNGWKDEKGRYYVRMSSEKGAELLGLSDKTFRTMKKELANYGLIEEVREGVTKSNRIYVGHLNYNEDDIYKLNNEVDDMLKAEEENAQSVDTTVKGKSYRSRTVKVTGQERYFLPTSNNDLNKTKNNNINNKQPDADKPKKDTAPEEKNVVVEDIKQLKDLLKDKGLQVNESTIKQWTSLDTIGNTIQAVQECLHKPNVRNRVGYITNMLKRGYEPVSAPKNDLPFYIASPQIDDVEISHEDKKEVLDLLLQLGEINQQEYDIKIMSD